MKKELIDMAKAAGIQEGEFNRYKGEGGKRKAYMMLPEELEAFADLVTAADRERILAVIGDNQCECRCAEVVRARGETK